MDGKKDNSKVETIISNYNKYIAAYNDAKAAVNDQILVSSVENNTSDWEGGAKDNFVSVYTTIKTELENALSGAEVNTLQSKIETYNAKKRNLSHYLWERDKYKRVTKTDEEGNVIETAYDKSQLTTDYSTAIANYNNAIDDLEAAYNALEN